MLIRYNILNQLEHFIINNIFINNTLINYITTNQENKKII